MKTLLQKYIDACRLKMAQDTQTKWYDSGVRDVYFEGYLKGLQKAQRLVNKQVSELSKVSDEDKDEE